MPVTDIYLSFLAKIMTKEILSPASKPPIPLFFPSVLIGFLTGAGIDEKKILAGTNITSAKLQSPDIRVSYADHFKLIANAEKLWGRPSDILACVAPFLRLRLNAKQRELISFFLAHENWGAIGRLWLKRLLRQFQNF